MFFKNEADFHEHWEDRVKGDEDFVIIPNEGPRGGPGMVEMLKSTTALVGKFGKDARIGLMTDGRFSGGSVGGAPIVGHVDEAFGGGLIGIIQNGDIIKVDPAINTMNLLVEQEEIDRRIKNYKVPEAVLERIAQSPQDLKLYHAITSSAREGATMLFS